MKHIVYGQESDWLTSVLVLHSSTCVSVWLHQQVGQSNNERTHMYIILKGIHTSKVITTTSNVLHVNL